MSLRGASVVVTRPPHQAGALVRLLSRHGAVAVEYPVVDIAPVGGAEARAVAEGAATLARGAYDGLILTSANAVRLLDPHLRAAGVRDLGVVYAVGPKTAEAVRDLELGGVLHVASTAIAEGVVELLDQHARFDSGRALRFFFPRARGGRATILDALRTRSAAVDAPVLYDTVPCPGPPLAEGRVDWLTFTSPSSVRAFRSRNPTDPEGARVACIGPTTADAARTLGMRVDVVPGEQTIEAMVAVMAGAEGAP